MDSTARNLRILVFARTKEIEGGMDSLIHMRNITERGIVYMQEKDDLIKRKKCPLCHRDIGPTEFDGLDSLYRDEFDISGLCRECQDEVFNEDDDDEEF